jgi:signal peptidase complex subunit 2
MYNLTVTYYTASQPSVPNTLKISRPFMQWFDAAGHFVALPFQQMFAGEVSVIGKADPTKAVAVDGKLVQTTAASQGLQPALDGITAGRGTGASANEISSSATPRKSGKSRKKA